MCSTSCPAIRGDPARHQRAARSLAALRHQLGIDRPLILQYLEWIGGALTGDLGKSITYGVPVSGLIADRLALTLPLAILAVVISTALALFLGVMAATFRDRGIDRAVRSFAQLGIAVPDFWIGLLLILLFSTTLNWFSAGGWSGWGDGPGRALAALILPAIALALPQAGVLTRVTRAAVLDVLEEDFIRTARAKGLDRRTALWRHALPNALLPVITILGLQFSFLVAGAVLVENVFSLPGLGHLAYLALARATIVLRNGDAAGGLVIPGEFHRRSSLSSARSAAEGQGMSEQAVALRAARRWPSTLVTGGAITGAFILIALLSRIWTPESPTRIHMALRLKPPLAAGLLGTDPFGRDVLSMLMAGTWTSLTTAFLSVLLGLLVGVALGSCAAALRGRFEEVAMRGADVVFAFPAIITAIMVTNIFGPGQATAVTAIGIFIIPVFARLARAAALQIWARDFCLAAQAAGKGRLRITIEHVIPNIAGGLLVQATIQLALAILIEAGLSYLGLGLPPPTPSWGRMLNDAQTFLDTAPWLAVAPGVAIALAVLGFNLLGDGLRDLFDPRREGRR